jgi:hypothetical protein
MKRFIIVLSMVVFCFCCTVVSFSALLNYTDNSNGDVNNDGYIDVRDATVIQKYAAEIITDGEINVKNADFNNDGSINISDATAIQHYIAENGFVVVSTTETTTTKSNNAISLPMIPID